MCSCSCENLPLCKLDRIFSENYSRLTLQSAVKE
jgi:hypothetical protein